MICSFYNRLQTLQNSNNLNATKNMLLELNRSLRMYEKLNVLPRAVGTDPFYVCDLAIAIVEIVASAPSISIHVLPTFLDFFIYFQPVVVPGRHV
jgi:hypothetical protein